MISPTDPGAPVREKIGRVHADLYSAVIAGG